MAELASKQEAGMRGLNSRAASLETKLDALLALLSVPESSQSEF
jgi:hypothetical protein